jgi:hypothetical protein
MHRAKQKDKSELNLWSRIVRQNNELQDWASGTARLLLENLQYSEIHIIEIQL